MDFAPVAQLDRAMVFETIGWGFEPLRAYLAFFAEFGVLPAISVVVAFWLFVFSGLSAPTEIASDAPSTTPRRLPSVPVDCISAEVAKSGRTSRAWVWSSCRV